MRPLARWMPSLFGGRPESGNCAYWISQGLVQAGLLKKPSSFPLVVFFKLLLSELLLAPGAPRVNIILYRSVTYDSEPKGALMYPLHWLRHSYRPFWNMERLATFNVHAIAQPSPRKPSLSNGDKNNKDEEQTPAQLRMMVSENQSAKAGWTQLQQEMLRVRKLARDFFPE
jgi:hypothetical protein